MDKNCSLTVIIPAKDEENTLPTLLTCLQDQTFQDFNIIVADASIGDKTKTLCQNRGIVCVKGGLPGIGRNTGAKYTSSEYLLFLDADVRIPKNFIADALEVVRHENADALSFGFIADTKNKLLRFLHWVLKYYFFWCTRLGFIHGIGGAIFVKKKIHDAINGFDETIKVLEDFEYCKRISKKSKYIFTIKPSVYLSTRRLEGIKLPKMILNYILMELHRLFFGEIRHGKFSYFKE